MNNLLRILVAVPFVLLPAVTVGADLAEVQLKLLKTFRGEFIRLKPGNQPFGKSFQMGGDKTSLPAEQPAHAVTMPAAFSVARYEVPQNLWEAVMGDNPSKWKGPRNSVEMLSFDAAQKFCKKITRLMRDAELIEANEVVRLPSEAEWEYFARAGTTTKYSFGNREESLDDFGWHTGNAAGNDPPVGAKKPNPWGLYDIHGYLWEWCLDTGHPNYNAAPRDGSAWIDATNSTRVLRGGSWKDKAAKLTSSFRYVAPATLEDDAVGLRCVLAPRSSQ